MNLVNIKEVTLLSDLNSKVFSSMGTRSVPTDFAILIGADQFYDDYDYYDKSLLGRTGPWWLNASLTNPMGNTCYRDLTSHCQPYSRVHRQLLHRCVHP